MATEQTQNQHEVAYMSLTRGLSVIDVRTGAIPCDLVLTGDHAFPIVMNSQGQVLMAASLYGKGRIVVLGHETYMYAFPDLVENALTWLRGDGSENLSVGFHRVMWGVTERFSKPSFQAKAMGSLREDKGVGVYVTNAYTVGPEVKELVAFMKAGGGVLIGGQAWHWSQSNSKRNTLLEFPGNKVSGVAGIYFTHHTANAESLPVYPQIPTSWMAIVLGRDFEDDLLFLLHGVSEFDLQGGSLSSEILVHGSLAFPIGTTAHGQTFLAASYYGKGRVIVVSHEGFMARESLQTFWNNAVHWLDEGRQGTIGIQANVAFNTLSKSGLKCEKTNFRDDLSVFVCTAYSGDHAEEIQNFVAEGGGLLIGGHAWYWAQNHGGQNPLTGFPGNRILNKMGLSLLGGTIGGGLHKAPEPSQALKETYHFRHLLHRFACHVSRGDELSKHEEGCLSRLSSDCSAYLNMKAFDCSSYTQVVSTLTEILKKSGIPQVCESCPVRSPKDRLLLCVGSEVYKVSPDRDALLPHLIKNPPVMPVVYNHKVEINVNTKSWHCWISTGLYLAPGMKTYLVIPPEIVNKGWQVQIGCQTDHLKSAELKRAPNVHEIYNITSGMMQVSNLWGGLIYLMAPHNAHAQNAVVTAQMAILAPYYKSGVTSVDDWRSLRSAPSPWAELEFENVILTVPSDSVRNLENPEELAALWDEMMRAIADLAVIPHKFGRKERFVADVQISHGWMHAGYPVMGHQATGAELVSVHHIRNNGLWGPIHELGHNQQRSCWEFPSHTTECTCNLWSVYVHDVVLRMTKEKAHPNLKPERRNDRIRDFVNGGRNLAEWHTFMALETYMQLQETFGWEAFKKVFAAYHNMSNVPKDNNGKMNLYCETFSQAVEKNLCGFFKSWSWPIVAATEQKLSNLPAWTDHPMVQYG